MSAKKTMECDSEIGITIGLIDSLISICHVLKGRDLSSQAAQEALEDFNGNHDFYRIISHTAPSDSEAMRIIHAAAARLKSRDIAAS